MTTPLINPDEKKAIKILNAFRIVLQENPMEDFASYGFIGQQIAIMLDTEMKLLNENNKLQISSSFDAWMHKQMGC